MAVATETNTSSVMGGILTWLKNLFPGTTFYRIRCYTSEPRTGKSLKLSCVGEAKRAGKDFEIKCIFGEMKSVYVLEQAVDIPNCRSIKVVFGPSLMDTAIKERLVNVLKRDGSNKISLYSLKERPVKHSVQISDFYIYEDIHEPCDRAKWITFYPHARARIKKEFDDNFYGLIKNEGDYKTINLGNVGAMPTLN